MFSAYHPDCIITSDPDTLISILQRAKEHVVTGWTQGVSREVSRVDGRIKVCAVEAVNQACLDLFQDSYWLKWKQDVRTALAMTSCCGGTFSHNDDHATSAGDVLDWFDAAIRHIKEGGAPMNPVTQKIINFIDQFATADEFRTYCQGQGITGRPLCSEECLIAIALSRALALKWVAVDGGHIHVDTSGDVPIIPLPRAMKVAVTAFDNGNWPELIAEVQS